MSSSRDHERLTARARIPFGHSSLELGSAAQSVHHTAELDEEAVARRLD
jgi:hypothetical protein